MWSIYFLLSYVATFPLFASLNHSFMMLLFSKNYALLRLLICCVLLILACGCLTILLLIHNLLSMLIILMYVPIVFHVQVHLLLKLLLLLLLSSSILWWNAGGFYLTGKKTWFELFGLGKSFMMVMVAIAHSRGLIGLEPRINHGLLRDHDVMGFDWLAHEHLLRLHHRLLLLRRRTLIEHPCLVLKHCKV